ncbi:hypothetical protein ISCGN_010188 [Ixodes scapularis]
MLRNLPAQEKDTLLDTVNEIWVSGQLPPWMKHAVVAPIPKAGKRSNEVPNLRPVSLTSTICKLLERLCLNRLNHHLEEVSFFFHPHQTGFRPNLSTQDSIYLLRRLLSTKRGRRRTVPSILVAVDLKKAFDSVTHEAVIRDLKEAYPGKRMLNIIKSFLCNRTFEVRSGRDEPKQFSSCVGVPQGAILSPLLFNVVMTGVARELELIHGVRFTLYADDITIWTEADDHEDTESAIMCTCGFVLHYAIRRIIDSLGNKLNSPRDELNRDLKHDLNNSLKDKPSNRSHNTNTSKRLPILTYLFS